MNGNWLTGRKVKNKLSLFIWNQKWMGVNMGSLIPMPFIESIIVIPVQCSVSVATAVNGQR